MRQPAPLHSPSSSSQGTASLAGLPRARHTGATEAVEIKVVRTSAAPADVALYHSLHPGAAAAGSSTAGSAAGEGVAGAQQMPVGWAPDTGDLLLPCSGGSSVLRVVQVQPPTKKAIATRDFRNGLRGKGVFVAAGRPGLGQTL